MVNLDDIADVVMVEAPEEVDKFIKAVSHYEQLLLYGMLLGIYTKHRVTFLVPESLGDLKDLKAALVTRRRKEKIKGIE
jgi:hypothetical protein